MKVSMPRLGLVAVAVVVAMSGCASTDSGDEGTGASGGSGGSVNLGMSTTLSGSIASLGQTGLQGAQLAVAELNANGGVLDKQVKLVTADDGAKPETGATNARNMIRNDHVVALLGPVSSAVAAAEAGIAEQTKTPIFFHTSNDASLTGEHFSNYVFQVVPSTYMEPRAVAQYVAEQGKYKRIYTISPDYVFGHSTVDTFLSAMKEFGADAEVVGQQWPALGASDYSPYITAALAADPDLVFLANYGGDLVTLTKQGAGFGLFTNSVVAAQYSIDALDALGEAAPSGTVAWSRAPFFAIKGDDMEAFVSAYHDKYDSYPSDWAVMAYTAVQSWAEGAEKAGSFDGDKLADALSGATVPTIRGDLTFRDCDHMAEVPEYVGTISANVDPTYGMKTFDDVLEADPSKIMMSCDQVEKLQNK